MSDNNPIESDGWPSYGAYATLQDAISGAARFIPAHRPEFLLLFEQIRKLALDYGYEWDIQETAPVAMAVLNAIVQYGEKDAGPGLEPKELEAWLNKSKRLAHDLRQILLSQEGQDRFAHIIRQGYSSDELANPLGPSPEKNVLLNLLEQIETEGPLSQSDALDLKMEQLDEDFLATEPGLKEVFAAEVAAAATVRGQEIHQRIGALFAQYNGSTPHARDAIRRHLIAEVIRSSCRCLGPDASRSLISGNTPWKLLEEIARQVLAYVGKHRGATKFEPWQDLGDFRYALKYARLLAQVDQLHHELRVVERDCIIDKLIEE